MQSEKSKLTAYLLWLAIGAFGAHRFYLGRVKTGIALAVLLVGAFILFAIGIYLLYILALDPGAIDYAWKASSLTTILSGFGSLLLLVWLIWYLLDLIFINVMINKDRKNANTISTKQAEKVFE